MSFLIRQKEVLVFDLILSVFVGEDRVTFGTLIVCLFTVFGTGRGNLAHRNYFMSLYVYCLGSFDHMLRILIREQLFTLLALPVLIIPGLGTGRGLFFNLFKFMTVGVNCSLLFSRRVAALAVVGRFSRLGAGCLSVDGKLFIGLMSAVIVNAYICENRARICRCDLVIALNIRITYGSDACVLFRVKRAVAYISVCIVSDKTACGIIIRILNRDLARSMGVLYYAFRVCSRKTACFGENSFSERIIDIAECNTVCYLTGTKIVFTVTDISGESADVPVSTVYLSIRQAFIRL